MVDAWTKQVLENGSRNYVAQYTCLFSSTSALTNYTAADPTSGGDMGVSVAGNTLYPGTHLKIMRLEYDITDGLSLRIYWDASAAQNAVLVNGAGAGKHNYVKQGGLFVPQSNGAPISGATGKILFDQEGTPAAGNIFSVTMFLRKDIAQ